MRKGLSTKVWITGSYMVNNGIGDPGQNKKVLDATIHNNYGIDNNFLPMTSLQEKVQLYKKSGSQTGLLKRRSKQSSSDAMKDEIFPYRKNFSGKMKPKKKDDLEQVGGLLNNLVAFFSLLTQKNKMRDYTNPTLPVASSAINATGQFSLGLDGKKIESETNVLLASIENMQYAVTLDVVNRCSDSYCSQGSIGSTLYI
ncbi:unnamed protein product [Lactuca virosa]|uniref:Uncharacterized protein n=1 Tax=Lactuca virosa TaxID=75947 RepID=A0AAU9MG53_9ASTR|nr:unnamed protein product [Lactuca virosa]